MMHLRARVLEFISACVRVCIKNFVTLQPLLDFTSKSHYENLRYRVSQMTLISIFARAQAERIYIFASMYVYFQASICDPVDVCVLPCAWRCGNTVIMRPETLFSYHGVVGHSYLGNQS